MSIGSFGHIVFETSADRIRTWSKFGRTGKVRFAEHAVHGEKPVLEYIGPGLEEISLQVRFDATLGVNPEKEIAALRELRDAGTAQQLIIGKDPLGRFAIASLEEDWQLVDNQGLLLVAIVSLTLKEDAHAD
jgi:phage protein U